MEARMDRALTAISTLCLVVIVALLARRELSPPEPPLPPAPPSLVSSWDSIVAISHPIAGDSNAAVVLLEFTDLQCPACKQFHEAELPKIVKRFGSKISVRVAHLPLRSHPHAMNAAIAADCARSQGRFAEYLERAFKWQARFGADSIWHAIAREAGVSDPEKFAACIARDDRSAVARSVELADAAGIRATPTLLINGWRDLAVPLERSVSKAIEAMSDSLQREKRRAR